ncbi:hypothetical protein SEA_MCGALLEON_63 [Microbacterium phage McGalleon]|uniref:Uncharacterized protein n=1 Tax=Microbacterium phage McGalleon TaxID=2590936 RepID=A0A516KQZ7_9CAUD|nr:hypothetical protein H3N88_gp63 [Microbacterium phage McGalleon]QDP44114.1 hypothetical protein SEA_MCGALLEON_63 [Microbacterium phage McGalleon]
MAGAVKDQPLFDLAQDRTGKPESLADVTEKLGGSIIPESGRIAQLRVRGTWRVLSPEWAEISVSIKDPIGDRFIPLTDSAVRVARAFSGSREAPELLVIAALRRFLSKDKNVKVLRLSGSEQRVGEGFTDYRYWACLSAPLSVGLVPTGSGTVAVVGL